MHPEDGPDNTAGDTVASARHPEYPPGDTGRESPVATGQLEDGPDGSPMETAAAQADHQTPTLAAHIQKHEDIETAAQDRANGGPSNKSGWRPSEPTTLSSTRPSGKSGPTRTGTSTGSSTRRLPSSGRNWRHLPWNTPASSRTWKQEPRKIGSNTTG